MKEKNTAFVREHLKNSTSPEEGLSIINDATIHFSDMTFAMFYNEYLAQHPDIKNADVVRDSGLTRQYASQVMNGQKNPGRDKVIALCFAAGMDNDETDHALIYAGHSQLYTKDLRDIIIFNAIRWKNLGKGSLSNVIDLNILLSDQGFAPLDV